MLAVLLARLALPWFLLYLGSILSSTVAIIALRGVGIRIRFIASSSWANSRVSSYPCIACVCSVHFRRAATDLAIRTVHTVRPSWTSVTRAKSCFNLGLHFATAVRFVWWTKALVHWLALWWCILMTTFWLIWPCSWWRICTNSVWTNIAPTSSRRRLRQAIRPLRLRLTLRLAHNSQLLEL